MQLIIAVNCSARKTVAVPKALLARSLPRGSATDVAAAWRKRVSAAASTLPAWRLYNGRAFSIASSVARSAEAEFRVISAGMGLVHRRQPLPAYSLTVGDADRDSVLKRTNGSVRFSASEWWKAIRDERPGASPFRRLLDRYRSALLLIAVTEPYLRMIEDELARLPTALRRRIRILGARRIERLPTVLRSLAMPYDQRLDDALLVPRGTQFDFPARALSHFVHLIADDRQIEDAQAHARRVRQSLAHRQAPRLPRRSRIDAAALDALIQGLKREGLSKTAALRRLRSVRGIACEQARFGRAWGTE